MPAQFDSFGIRFLYPDNWAVAARGEEEGDQGATLDLPSGGFWTVEVTRSGSVEALIDKIVTAISSEYEELEREDLSLETLPEGTPVTDLRFYYLDLLIVSRIVVLPMPGAAPSSLLESVLPESGLPESGDDDAVMVIQMQAESRDFDKNEPVFAAILKQIVESA